MSNYTSQTYYYSSRVGENGNIIENGYGTRDTNGQVEHFLYNNEEKGFIPVDSAIYQEYVNHIPKNEFEYFLSPQCPFKNMVIEQEPQPQQKCPFKKISLSNQDSQPIPKPRPQPRPRQQSPHVHLKSTDKSPRKAPCRSSLCPLGFSRLHQQDEMSALREENRYLRNLLNNSIGHF